MKSWAILIVCSIALAGCADPDPQVGNDDGTDPTDPTGMTDDGNAADGSDQLPPVPAGWLMDDDETLHEGDPEETVSEEFPVSSFHKPLAGQSFDFYVGTGPTYEHDMVITDATFDITIRHDSVSLDPSSAIGTPGAYGMSVSSQESNGLISFFGQGQAQAHGAIETPSVDVLLPAGGLVLPAGTPLWLAAASLYINPDDVAGTVFLMNSADAPSGLTATAAWTVLPEVSDAERVLSESGTFPQRTPDQPGCGSSAQEGAGKFTHTVSIPDDAAQVFVQATATGNADVDIYIQAGGQTFGANFPGSPEFFRAYAPNIAAVGPGDWTIEVHNCGDGSATLAYDLEVEVHRVVPAD